MTNPLAGIVADDLTGALDTVGAFAAVGFEANVSLRPLERMDLNESRSILCLNTQTRNGSTDEAVEAVRAATAALVGRRCATLYKKVDSTLRGHVAVEVESMMRRSGLEHAFVCPAFPSVGRIVRDGLIYVGGAPLSEAQEGRDLLHPAATPSVVDTFMSRQGFRPALVELSEVETGAEELRRRIGILVEQGHNLIAFDATTQEHLDGIVEAVEGASPEGLLVGSAGLAAALAKRLAPDVTRAGRRRFVRDSTRPFLLVCGSRSTVAQTQLDRVIDLPGFRLVKIDRSAILEPATSSVELRRVADAAGSALREGEDAGLTWTASEPMSGWALENSRVLNSSLQTVVENLVQEVALSGLVLVGGDTAFSVLTAIGCTGIAVSDEMEPGVPLGTIRGRAVEGGFVITKAGGFGDEGLLARIVAHVRAGRDSVV